MEQKGNVNDGKEEYYDGKDENSVHFELNEITTEDVQELEAVLMITTVESIGQGRGGGYDKQILLKKMVQLQRKSPIGMELFAKIAKTFGIKFAIQGTRIKIDNTVTIEGKEYNATMVATLFEFEKSGKKADQSQLTPTRLSRLFATDAVNYCRLHKVDPPMYLQDDLKVTGLPAEYHFLAACYAEGSLVYANQLIALGRNFDTKLSDAIDNYDKKNGFGVRMSWWFQHYSSSPSFSEVKAAVKTEEPAKKAAAVPQKNVQATPKK